jgi:hypothetical protein
MRQDAKAHWEGVYAGKSDQELSWTQTDLRISLSLITRFTPSKSRIVDVGGGSSPLAGRLIDKGYSVAVLDISGAALARGAKGIGKRASEVRWIEADVTRIADLGSFDLWHDRAAFHFLTQPTERAAYRALMERTIPFGGHAVIATFAPDGPNKCSGLDVHRYDSTSLALEVGESFELVESLTEMHLTPWGSSQPFQYSLFRRKNSG